MLRWLEQWYKLGITLDNSQFQVTVQAVIIFTFLDIGASLIFSSSELAIEGSYCPGHLQVAKYRSLLTMRFSKLITLVQYAGKCQNMKSHSYLSAIKALYSIGNVFDSDVTPYVSLEEGLQSFFVSSVKSRARKWWQNADSSLIIMRQKRIYLGRAVKFNNSTKI